MRRFFEWLPFFLSVALSVALISCSSVRRHRAADEACAAVVVAADDDDPSLVLVTGYCNCGKCCGWERKWFGFGEPVYNYGKLKGKPKKVGVTASGKVARHGTIAADPKLFPFGTRLNVPGYGVGTVEDIGGAIRGRHIDVWFPSHEEAKRWGARKLRVTRAKK